ncbi:hypothetical protein GCM10010255_75180 [Streptomyces coeruleofuscus]|uniref:Uncharacterized protein n=1 Tax=Streptomyces coeruleofuscus TaxID=66879 RepID=A0ABN3J620_9ACTN
MAGRLKTGADGAGERVLARCAAGWSVTRTPRYGRRQGMVMLPVTSVPSTPFGGTDEKLRARSPLL